MLFHSLEDLHVHVHTWSILCILVAQVHVNPFCTYTCIIHLVEQPVGSHV